MYKNNTTHIEANIKRETNFEEEDCPPGTYSLPGTCDCIQEDCFYYC